MQIRVGTPKIKRKISHFHPPFAWVWEGNHSELAQRNVGPTREEKRVRTPLLAISFDAFKTGRNHFKKGLSERKDTYTQNYICTRSTVSILTFDISLLSGKKMCILYVSHCQSREVNATHSDRVLLLTARSCFPYIRRHTVCLEHHPWPS